MSDLISRHDAIDALSEDVMGGLNYRRILQALPSAEPHREDWEDYDYELATEQMEHDAMYEPTYNSEDGSM